tara:strand:- start:1071 stop:1220 length:150 start_codon:yes stop_codon:yes gene_type:complete
MKTVGIILFISLFVVLVDIAHAPTASFCDKHYKFLQDILEPQSFERICG